MDLLAAIFTDRRGNFATGFDKISPVRRRELVAME